MSSRYAWPADLSSRGSTWSDYTRRGRWTHSALWAKDGTLLAELWPAYSRKSDDPKSVIWSTVFGDKGEEQTRRKAKRAARKSCLEFLEG